MPLLNKLYCPREVFPLSAMGDATFDALIASMILLVLFPIYGFAPKIETLWLPVVLLPLLMASIGVALVTSVVTVYVRDFRPDRADGDPDRPVRDAGRLPPDALIHTRRRHHLLGDQPDGAGARLTQTHRAPGSAT